MSRPPWLDPAAGPLLVERVLLRTWHCVGDDRDLRVAGAVSPRVLLPGCLDEPVLSTFDGEVLRAFANVCTHRLSRLVDTAGVVRVVQCPYHGRTFGLDGRCRAQRGLSGVVEGFPGNQDHLAPLAVARWAGLVFCAVDPAVPFESTLGPLATLIDADGMAGATVEEGPSYEVDAPFVAWCENYLEALHVPFVHPGLHRILDDRAYLVRPHDHGGSVQIGVVGPDVPALVLPADHPDAARRVGGLYGCLFPTTMINVYPWGVSLNRVQPLGPWRTRVAYTALVQRPTLRDQGAGAALDVVEAEDQAIVARVGQGMRSRLARAPRLVPGHEDAVAAWHHELQRLMATE